MIIRICFSLTLAFCYPANAQTSEPVQILEHSKTVQLSDVPMSWNAVDISAENDRLIVPAKGSYQIWRINEQTLEAEFDCKFAVSSSYQGCQLEEEDELTENFELQFEGMSPFTYSRIRKVVWHAEKNAFWVVLEPKIGERDRTARVILDDGKDLSVFISYQWRTSNEIAFARHCNRLALYDDFAHTRKEQTSIHYEARFIDAETSNFSETYKVPKSEPVLGTPKSKVWFHRPKLDCNGQIWAHGTADWNNKAPLIFNFQADSIAKFYDLYSGRQQNFAVTRDSSKIVVYDGVGLRCDSTLVVSHGPCQGEIVSRKDHPVLWVYDVESGDRIWQRKQDVGGSVRAIDPVILPDQEHAVVVLQPKERVHQNWKEFEEQTLEVIRLDDGKTVQSVTVPSFISQVDLSRDQEFVTVITGNKELIFFKVKA